MRTITLIVIHCSAVKPDQMSSAAQIDSWHRKRGFHLGIGYHYVIRKDGTIEQGRPLGTVGAHCYGENYHTVGVNIVGNFEIAEPEPAQMASAARLLAAICRFYGFAPGSDTIFGHRDFNATACPGENLYVRLPELIRMTQAQY